MIREPEPTDDDELERQRIWNAVRRVVPGQAITKDTWEALGYGPDGKRRRNLTDDPMGYKPRPRPETPTT